ncbi:uncharacterized protein [Epargyreus clarus]|uniref:uncharacterized protein n=1 Tax=Epargyreus clarus TaxID=520877 RepID=UPI003C2D199D
MISGIKRRIMTDPETEAVPGPEKNLKAEPNGETGLKEKIDLKLKATPEDTHEPGLVGKFKLNLFPGLIIRPNAGKVKLNVDKNTETAILGSTIAETAGDMSMIESTADAAKTIAIATDPMESDTVEVVNAANPIIIEPHDTDSDSEISKPTPATTDLVSNDSADAEPSDGEACSFETIGVEPNPADPAAAKPLAANIGGIIEPAVPQVTDDVSDDSDEPDGQEDEEDKNPFGVFKATLTFLMFWAVNALFCFMALELAYYPSSTFRALFETKPIYYPMELVLRDDWSQYNDMNVGGARKTFVAKRVTVVQTDTEQCQSFDECIQLLNNLERAEGQLPYNFVISPSGKIFEARGWNEASPMFPEIPTMLVALIGNFEDTEPTKHQLNKLKTLLETSEHIEYLDNFYKITGKKIKYSPKKLYQNLMAWRQYEYFTDDSENVTINLDPQVLDKD